MKREMSGGKANIQSLPVGEMWDVSVSKLERGGEVQYSVSGEKKVSTVVKLKNYPSLSEELHRVRAGALLCSVVHQSGHGCKLVLIFVSVIWQYLEMLSSSGRSIGSLPVLRSD